MRHVSKMSTTVQQLLDRQMELVTKMVPSKRRVAYTIRGTERQRTVETMCLVMALHCELTELMDALNWKYWKKTQKRLDYENIQEEIADMWHFLMELTLLWQVDIEKALNKTFTKNHSRADGDY